MDRDPWERLWEEAEKATYVDCRVLKRMGMVDSHQVGDIIGVEEKGVKELVEAGYIEVVEESEKNGS
ncbi:hypothetical protein AB6A23_11095 [Paenibacillus tarimensis]